jgi:hypothetical protein
MLEEQKKLNMKELIDHQLKNIPLMQKESLFTKELDSKKKIGRKVIMIILKGKEKLFHWKMLKNPETDC